MTTFSNQDVRLLEVSKDPSKISTVCSETGLSLAQTMRRVDWRWAVAKGFLNKETNQWNEKLGGKEAYLKQRNERMLARCKCFWNFCLDLVPGTAEIVGVNPLPLPTLRLALTIYEIKYCHATSQIAVNAAKAANRDSCNTGINQFTSSQASPLPSPEFPPHSHQITEAIALRLARHPSEKRAQRKAGKLT